jgi:hypothetical protein
VRLSEDSVHLLVPAREIAGSHGDFERARTALLHVVRGEIERDILADTRNRTLLLVVLGLAAVFARWRAVWMAQSETVRFEDRPPDEILVLGLTQGKI